jgi:hypothetical protein
MTVVVRICSVEEQCGRRRGRECVGRTVSALWGYGITMEQRPLCRVGGGPRGGRLDRGWVKPEEGCWVLWTWDRGVDNACESGFDRLGKVPRPGVRSAEAARMLTKRGEEGCQ